MLVRKRPRKGRMRMGHGKKNANRGEAINRNAARISKLAEKVGELGKELKVGFKGMVAEAKAADEAFQNLREVFGQRLTELEKPWWRKIMDKVKDKKKRGDPANPNHRAVIMDRSSVRKRPKDEEKKEEGKKEGGG